MTAPAVVLALIVCGVTAGEIHDDCEHIEIRARSCAEAAAWARGWIPAGHVVASAACSEERVASR
jgi:hypothetical protein